MNKNYQQNFHEVMLKYTDSTRKKRVFKKAESLYLIKSFKISGISSEEAIESYDRLLNKYETKELQSELNDWQKNERKLFIWFLICYCEERKESIQNLDENEWIQMAQIFFNKNVLFLKFQGLSILKNTKRHNWAQEDDELLQKYVEEIGSNEWSTISKSIFFLKSSGKFISPKQCRERWFNHICGEINKSEWSKEEDLHLLKLSLELGKKWSSIVRSLNTNRTEDMVRNRYYSLINKVRIKKKDTEEILFKKALILLEENQNSQSNQEQEKEENLQNQKESIFEKEIQKIKYEKTHKECQTSENEYHLNFIPEGHITHLRKLIQKKEKGYYAFNVDEGFVKSEYVETNPLFSITANVKTISTEFSTHSYYFQDFFTNNENLREYNNFLFIPITLCYNPPVNYFSIFNPSFDLLPLVDDCKENEEKYANKDIQTQIFSSFRLCSEKSFINIKKEANE